MNKNWRDRLKKILPQFIDTQIINIFWFFISDAPYGQDAVDNIFS